MIRLFTGTPGSGKSLHCAEIIFKRISSGKTVIANFDINMTVFKKRRKLGTFVFWDNTELSVKKLLDYALTKHRRNTNGNMVEGQTLLIIDECQILFNAREWSAKGRNEWCTFFTQHRKYGYDIIFVTQFDRLIDRQMRSLVEYEVIHRKVSNFKTFGAILGILCGGHLFVAVTRWYALRERIESKFFMPHKKYMRLYDSYKLFSADGGGGQGAPPTSAENELGQSDPNNEMEAQTA